MLNESKAARASSVPARGREHFREHSPLRRTTSPDPPKPIKIRWTKRRQRTESNSYTLSAARVPTPAGSAPDVPMPTRRPPLRLFEPHEVHPHDVIDQVALAPKRERNWMTYTRNLLMRKQLQDGAPVTYRSSGSSLSPIVQSGDCCIIEPILDCGTLVVGDIVFCEVQPTNRFYAHKVLHIGVWHGRRYFDIGNNHDPPHKNGWCYDCHIYGQMVEVIE